MTAIYQEMACPAPPAASTPAIDFAIVLARTIAAADKDPAQLRNVVTSWLGSSFSRRLRKEIFR